MIKFGSEDIFDIEIMRVERHIKKGIEVPCHLHFNVTFLVEACENSKLKINKDENSGVKWIKNENILTTTNEKHILYVYKRLMKKVSLLDKQLVK